MRTKSGDHNQLGFSTFGNLGDSRDIHTDFHLQLVFYLECFLLGKIVEFRDFGNGGSISEISWKKFEVDHHVYSDG